MVKMIVYQVCIFNDMLHMMSWDSDGIVGFVLLRGWRMVLECHLIYYLEIGRINMI